jgi:hypothetical protein
VAGSDGLRFGRTWREALLAAAVRAGRLKPPCGGGHSVRKNQKSHGTLDRVPWPAAGSRYGQTLAVQQEARRYKLMEPLRNLFSHDTPPFVKNHNF